MPAVLRSVWMSYFPLPLCEEKDTESLRTMRVIHKEVDKYSSGHITLIAENEEDMWLTYNLVQVGDQLRCSTVRKVQNESATGSVQTKQVRTNLTINVEKIDFDLQGSVLHLKGRNVAENQFVKMGAYHTLDLSLDEKFTIFKSEWDSIALMLVEQAADPTQHADLAAVIMHEGLAYVCLVTSTTTIVRAKIEINIPRKRPGLPTTQHEKGMTRFFEQIMQALERHVRFDIVKCVILASPGFVREQFFDYLMQTSTKQDKRVFLENKGKFVLVHSSSGHKHALKEVLMDSSIQSKLANTKAAAEVNALNDFYQMLKVDQSRAFYGYKHVKAASDALAIDTLLVSDALFRSRDLEERRRYVSLVDTVKEDQGTVRIFSSLHVSGEQLNQLSGVAAILRFPIPEPNSDEDSDSSTENATCLSNVKFTMWCAPSCCMDKKLGRFELKTSKTPALTIGVLGTLPDSGPSTRTDRFARPASHSAEASVRPSLVTTLNISKSIFKTRKPVYLAAFKVRTLKQTEQRVTLARTLDSLCFGVRCLSETRMQDASTVIELTAPRSLPGSGCAPFVMQGRLQLDMLGWKVASDNDAHSVLLVKILSIWITKTTLLSFLMTKAKHTPC
ncbi:Protein pelota [Clonorchis sinensis]|uniref:Protein pelota n=1 Tax=Clonorchis sinensis TaxID=79923 RepID=A0A3R7DP81_CLOSI|nr:Protein pelota [Clonorchis sinensis]